MSSPTHSPHPSLNNERILPPDVVEKDSEPYLLHEEKGPYLSDPPEPDPPAFLPTPPAQDPDNQKEEEEREAEDEEAQEQETSETTAIPSGMRLLAPPITSFYASPDPDVALDSPVCNPDPWRGGGGTNKRKKGKGKGKGKPNFKRQQTIDKRLTLLRENLNPIPFMPQKLLDFAKHEKLFKKLGLWDFVQIEFDRDLRVDLLAEFIATYESRVSYVGGYRIKVSRADLARALKMPVKKEKGNLGGADVGLDSEDVSEDSVVFLEQFVSDWVLLHEDTWMMPNEVLNWLKLIKEGQPEKVDWAGLLWFMVDKELVQGDKLVDCYYASHLQCLIKCQRPELFSPSEPTTEFVQLDAESKEEDDECVAGDTKFTPEVQGEDDFAMGGPSIELTLGQDDEKEEDVKDDEVMDAEGHSSDDEGRGEEQEQWLLHGKNNLGGHFLQQCRSENVSGFFSLEDGKVEEGDIGMEEDENEEEDEQEEADDRFHDFPNDDDALEGDGLTGNLLQTMEANQLTFSSAGQLRDPSSMDISTDIQHMASAPSFFNQMGKRVLEHDNDISHPALGEGSKRLRINDSWDPKPHDFSTCIENIQQMIDRARMFHEEKEQDLQRVHMHEQILLNEVQKRDEVISHLQKTRYEEIQKRDAEIYRLERELYLIGGVLDGYKKAFKETKKAFEEYRQRAQLPEEPVYRDAGPGGLVLSIGEVERIRKKQEEEYRMNCLIVEEKMKEAMEGHVAQFGEILGKMNLLDTKLTSLEADAKELITSYARRKLPETGEKVLEMAEGDEALETAVGDEVFETAEEETVVEAAGEETVIEAAEAEEETVIEAAEGETALETAEGEVVLEAAEGEAMFENTEGEMVLVDAEGETAQEDAEGETALEDAEGEMVLEAAETVFETAKILQVNLLRQ